MRQILSDMIGAASPTRSVAFCTSLYLSGFLYVLQ